MPLPEGWALLLPSHLSATPLSTDTVKSCSTADSAAWTAAQGGVQRDRVGAGLQLGLAGVQRGFQRSGLLRQLRQDLAVYPVPHGGGLAPEVVQLFQLVGIGVLQIAYRVFLFFDKLGLLCLGGHCLHLRQRRLGNGHQFVQSPPERRR